MVRYIIFIPCTPTYPLLIIIPPVVFLVPGTVQTYKVHTYVSTLLTWKNRTLRRNFLEICIAQFKSFFKGTMFSEVIKQQWPQKKFEIIFKIIGISLKGQTNQIRMA